MTSPTIPSDADHWRQVAACRDKDSEAWFPGNEAPEAQWAHARSICNACPAVADCLEDSLTVGDDYGMFGGKTPKERAAIRKRARRIPRSHATDAEHGTEAGAKRHRRRHETVCDACRHGEIVAMHKRGVRNGAA